MGGRETTRIWSVKANGIAEGEFDASVCVARTNSRTDEDTVLSTAQSGCLWLIATD